MLSHPMALIPYFRRFRPSQGRDLVFTALMGLAIALFFFLTQLDTSSVHRMAHDFWVSLVIAETISYTIHGFFELGDRLLKPLLARGSRWRFVYYFSLPTLGVFLGSWVGYGLLDMHAARRLLFSPSGVIGTLVSGFVVCGALILIYLARERQIKVESTLAAEKERVLDAERRALEAQLRMLQAQIEPHFLYNTLANAVGLIQPAPDRARLLLERLIDYLRASLAASRETSTTLQREINTLHAYLDLMSVRMGERLRYRLDLPSALSGAALPPMLIQPLVENAIQHGLEPKVAGGEIAIEVSELDGSLLIVIADTGAGFDPSAKPRPGGGVGLTNLRERLDVLYGDHASLSIADNLPCGVRVSLRLPLLVANATSTDPRCRAFAAS